MTWTGTESLTHARALHRAGHLDDALRAYEALLPERPEDPDLIGLLGVIALQDGRLADAEASLRRAVALGGDGRLRTRNLNNLVVLLREAGRGDEARALLQDQAPEWPRGVPAEESERAGVLSLAEALIGYEQPCKARHLLDAAIPDRDGDAEALNLDGRLRLEAEDVAGAVEVLEQATRLAPEDAQPLIALGYAQEKSGRPDLARAAAQRVARLHPVYSSPARPSQQATLLVLNPQPSAIRNPNSGVRGLHFATNFASQIATSMQDEYRFLSIFGNLPPDALPDPLPEADLVLNNIVNAEPMNVPGRLDAVRAVVARLGRPVINPPEAVFQTTRQKTALLLEGLANLKVPQIARYQTGLASVDEIVADIGAEFAYPVILRQVDAHESSKSLLTEDGKTAVLAPDAAAARDCLQRFDWREFYVVEFVDVRRPDGFYRKLRAMFVENEVIVNQAALYRDWMVSGWRSNPAGVAFYREHPETIRECNSIVSDPEAHLGAAALKTLEAIRDRVPLDVFGVDFEVDREGRVVFFEASAAMAIANPSAAADLQAPKKPMIEFYDALRAMVRRRLAGAENR